MATSVLLPEKGLDNRPGQNNCFLNVCVQALWHLSAFRSQFLSSKAHVHNETSCIYCVLKALFTHYQFSDEQVLPPTALRTALAVLHRDLDRFQLGELDDAAEALEAILTCLNKVYLVKGKEKEKVDESNPNSISNKVFGCPIAEIVQCGKCKKDIKPQGSDSFIYYTYVTEIREASRRNPDLSFDNLLKRLSESVKRSCPNEKCDEKNCSVRRLLLQQPHVFAVGLVWSTPNPSAQEIVEMLNVISLQIRLSNIFDGVPVQFTYRLKGMICYYGLHYDCYFYSPQRKQWLVFDDRVVKEVGASWEQLKDRCRRGRFHPSVLFYERVETGAPLPTTYTTSYNPQSITLNRNMFTTATALPPGFTMVSTSGYPVNHPYYRPAAFNAQGYLPYHPIHAHQAQLQGAPQAPSVLQQQASAESDRRKEEQAKALDEQRRREMISRAEAEAERKRKQQEEEEKRRQLAEEERSRKQVRQQNEREDSSDDESSSEEETDDHSESEDEETLQLTGDLPPPAVDKLPASPPPVTVTAAAGSPMASMTVEMRPEREVVDTAPHSATPSPAALATPIVACEPARSTHAPAQSSMGVAPPAIAQPKEHPVMVEDLLSVEDAVSVAPLLPSTGAAPARPAESPAATRISYAPALRSSTSGSAPAPPASAPRSTSPSAPAYTDLFNLPSVPTALPSAEPPISEPQVPPVDTYNDYSSKIDSISQSKYLAISKPTYNLASSSAYSRPTNSSFGSVSSFAPRPTATFGSSSSSSATTAPAAFPSSSSSTAAQGSTTRKKPQQSAFTNLSSLLSS